MEEIRTSKVTIATATYYTGKTESEKIRAALTVDTIRTGVELGYNIVVLDTGSREELVLAFETAGAIVRHENQTTYGASRRAALRAAVGLGSDIIVWTEPEKVGFVSQISRTLVPFMDESADMVIPKRKSLSSYPTVQQYAEQFGNAYFRELTGYDFDVWFGPRVFHKELLSYFLEYEGKYGDMWDALFVPILDMIHDGKRLVSVMIDYEHPKEQTAVEEHDLVFYDKRLYQLHNLVPALKEYWEKINS